jgi:hypothetical protein
MTICHFVFMDDTERTLAVADVRATVEQLNVEATSRDELVYLAETPRGTVLWQSSPTAKLIPMGVRA